MDTDITDLTKILLEFQKVPKSARARTFLEISGYPHYENVCSNILQFYLDPHNEHGLKDLVLNSLIQLADKDFHFECDFEKIEVDREMQTLSGNRLDLLITTENYVIGIENKVFHFLNNDLEDYSKTVRNKEGQKKAINIILSLNRLSKEKDIERANAHNFKTITYEDLFKNIRKNIGNYLSHSKPTYFIYLVDFMKSIENLKPSTMDNKKLWKFFHDNMENVQELTNLFNSYKEWLGKKAYQLMEILPKNEYAPNVHEQWIFKEGEFPALVHDYIITGSYKIAIDTCISKNGLEIQLFSKDDSSDYLFYTMCKQPDFLAKPLDQYVKTENGRLVIERFDLETEIEKVAETLKDILTRIEKYKSRVEGKK